MSEPLKLGIIGCGIVGEAAAASMARDARVSVVAACDVSAERSRTTASRTHFFAYNMEFITKRGFLHGELVSLGIVVMASLQGRDIESVLDLLGRLRIDFRLRHLGISPEELKECLRTLPDYCQHEGLPYSIVQELASSGQDLSQLPIVTNEREGVISYVA